MCLFNLCIFVICVLIQSSLGDSIEVDHGGPLNTLNNDRQEYDYNNTTTNQAPVEDEKACETALLQGILGVIVTTLRKDLSENAKTAYLLETLKGLLKNTAAHNKEVTDKVDDLLMTLDKYKEPGDVNKNSLRAGAITENSPLRFLVREPKTQNEKLRFRYELPSFTNSYCTEALLNIAKIALQAYTSLSKNPICNLPGIPDFPTKIDTPTINPQISELPIPENWYDLFPKNEHSLINNGLPPDYILNKNPEQLVPNFDILNDLENVPVPSKEYDEIILNQYQKRPQLNPVQVIDESYPLYPSDVNQVYNYYFPERPNFYPYQPQLNENPDYPFGSKPTSNPLNPFTPDEKPIYIPEVPSDTPNQVDNPAELIFEFPHQKNPSEPKNSPFFPFNLEVINPENPSVDLNTVDSKIWEPELAPFSKNPIHAYELEPIEITPDGSRPTYSDITGPNENAIYEWNLNEKPMQPSYDSIQETISEIIPEDDNYLVPVPTTPSKLPRGQDLKVIGFIRDAIDVIEGVIPVVQFDTPTLYIIAKIKNILLNEDKDIEIKEYEAIIELYKKLINYVKQLNSYDQIIDRLDLSRVTNSPKLETKKVVELTYLVKRPQPVVYYPYYYVKYRLPYSRFVVAAQNILKEKPLRMDANQYEELLAQSKVIETSPDLKNYGKKDILGLVFRSGSLVNAKLIGENATLTDHLDALKEITSDLSAEEMFKLNKEATNKIKLFTADFENVNPYKNINKRSRPVESIENDGINEENPIPNVLKRNQMLDVANSETKLNSNINQPTTEASFDSNKLRSTILRGAQVGIPFSDHFNNANLWQNLYLPSSSLPEQEQISPIMYKLSDATMDATLQVQNQLNNPSSGSLVNIDNDKEALKTGEEIEINVNISNPEFIINNGASAQNLENLGIEKASSSDQTISASKVDELSSTSDFNNLWSNQQNYFSTMQKGMNIGSLEAVEQTPSRTEYQHLAHSRPANENIENFLINPVNEEINQLDNVNGVEKESTSVINQQNSFTSYSLPHNELTRFITPRTPNLENNDILINTGNANEHLMTVKTEELISKPLISEDFIGSQSQYLQPSEFANQGFEHYDYQTGMENQQTVGDVNVNSDGNWVHGNNDILINTGKANDHLITVKTEELISNPLISEDFTSRQYLQPSGLANQGLEHYDYQTGMENQQTVGDVNVNSDGNWVHGNNDILINTGKANDHLITVKTEELISNPLISEDFTSRQYLQPSGLANQGLEHYDYQTGMENQQTVGDVNVNSDGNWVHGNNDILINTGKANDHLITVKTEELISNPLISEDFTSRQYLQPSGLANQGLEHYDYQTGMENQQTVGDVNVNSDGKWVQTISSQQSSTKFEPGSFTQQFTLPQSESNKLINQQVISDQIIWNKPESISQVSITNRQNFQQTESNSNKQASVQVLPGQQNYPPPGFYPENPVQQNNPQPDSYPESPEQQLIPSQQNQPPGSTSSLGQKQTLNGQNYPPSGSYPYDQEVIPSQQNYLPTGKSGQQAVSDRQNYAEPGSQEISISPQSGQEVIPSQQNTGQATMSQQDIGIYSSDSSAVQQAIASQQKIHLGNPDQEPIPSQQNYLPESYAGISGQQLTQKAGSFPGNPSQQEIPLRQKISKSGSQQIVINSQSGQQVIPSQQNSGQGTMSQHGIGVYSSDPSANQQAIASQQKIYHGKSDQEQIPSQQNYLPGSYNGNSGQQTIQSQQKYQVPGFIPGNSGQEEHIEQKYSQSQQIQQRYPAPGSFPGYSDQQEKIRQKYAQAQQFWINSRYGQQLIPNQQSIGIGIYSTNPSAIQQQQAIANQQYYYNANGGNYGQGYAQVRATVFPFASLIYKRPIEYIQQYSSYPVITRYTSPWQTTYLG